MSNVSLNQQAALRFCWLLLVARIVGQAVTATGSAVVIIRTTNEVLVGTDSKKTYGDNARPSKTACKIQQFGSTFFTQTGLTATGPTSMC
jgi:hypothetical protein